jgi:hypothetical protein
METCLTGLWHGQFSYPNTQAPEFFTANLLESGDFLGGSIQETAANGRHAGMTFYATVRGRRDGRVVSFLKIYETSPRTHRVRYDGTLSEDGTEIEGVWRVPGSWSGPFLMIRSSRLGQLVQLRVAETVEP